MWLIVGFSLLAAAYAQIPSLGFCPDYHPIRNFKMNRFLGRWFEQERYMTVTELGSRCVSTDYQKSADGIVTVSNEVQSSLTGFKRVLEGTLQLTGRDGEGKFMVKYNTSPMPYQSEFYILDTDYDSFAVAWSCSGIGPIHTQSAWILTRDRAAPRIVIERTYGVLERFKIPSVFFTKTDQDGCATLPDPVENPNPYLKSAGGDVDDDEVVGKSVVGDKADVAKSVGEKVDVVKAVEVKKHDVAKTVVGDNKDLVKSVVGEKVDVPNEVKDTIVHPKSEENVEKKVE